MDEQRRKEIIRAGYAHLHRRMEYFYAAAVVITGLICGVGGALLGLRNFLFFFALALLVVAGIAGVRSFLKSTRKHHA